MDRDISRKVWNNPFEGSVVGSGILSNNRKSHFHEWYITFWVIIICSDILYWSNITPICDPLTELDLRPNLTFYPIVRAFHRTFTTEDAYSSEHLVLSHFGTCMCSNVETNLSQTCLVPGLISFEHPSLLLFYFDRRTTVAGCIIINFIKKKSASLMRKNYPKRPLGAPRHSCQNSMIFPFVLSLPFQQVHCVICCWVAFTRYRMISLRLVILQATSCCFWIFVWWIWWSYGILRMVLVSEYKRILRIMRYTSKNLFLFSSIFNEMLL